MTHEGDAAEEQTRLLACTVCRDIRRFGQLIDEMDLYLGEAWGDLSLSDASVFFQGPHCRTLNFIALAIDGQDEENIEAVATIINLAKAQNIKVLLVASDVTPAILHQLLTYGAAEFIPYPLPEGALGNAIIRLQEPEPVAVAPPPTQHRKGILLPVQSMAGGAGASTVASNLAWELANIEGVEERPRVLLVDMNLQFGSVATYLDLPRSAAVYELLSSIDLMDDEAFLQAVQPYDEHLQVLTSPAELLPLDFLTGEEVDALLDKACEKFDYVVLDMPATIVSWTENILNRAEYFFAPIDLDLRSAHNVQRLRAALRAEEMPFEKFRFLLNRAPKGMDLGARARVKRMAENLEIAIDVQLPDGTKAVQAAGDQGVPLGIEAPKNPLRKELEKLAHSIFARHKDQKPDAA